MAVANRSHCFAGRLSAPMVSGRGEMVDEVSDTEESGRKMMKKMVMMKLDDQSECE
jgi:hypothetical protein